MCGITGWYGGRRVFRCSRHVGGASEVGSWEARECPWSVVVDVQSSPAYRRRCLTLGGWAAWREKGTWAEWAQGGVKSNRHATHVSLVDVAAVQQKGE